MAVKAAGALVWVNAVAANDISIIRTKKKEESKKENTSVT